MMMKVFIFLFERKKYVFIINFFLKLMLCQKNQVSNNRIHPSTNKFEQQKQQAEEELNFQQINNSHQSFENKSILKIKLITISLLSIITILIFMMQAAVSQNSELINKIINSHTQNNDLQGEFQNNVIDIKYDLKQIKAIAIQQKQRQENSLNHLKGIIKKYETNIDKIQKFLEKPQILVDEQLNIQAANILDLQRAKVSLKKMRNTNNTQIQRVTNDYKLEIPKNIWVFKQNPFNYIRKLVNQNRLYFANISGYTLHFVNYDSMRTYLPKKVQNTIRKNIQLLSKRLAGENLHFASKKLILLGFLQTYGGIMLDGLYALTQDLSWIEDILANQLVSRGNRYVKPKIVTFYNPLLSVEKQKFNILPFEGMEETDKFIIQLPKIQEYFIAAQGGTQFLEELINKINDLINDIDNFWKYNKKYNLKLDKTEDFLKNIIFAASRIIITEKQKDLDSTQKNNYKQFAFDYYGINCINAYYGPLKSNVVFQQNIHFQGNLQPYYHMVYHDLAHYSYEEITSYIGGFKYLSNFNFQYYLNNFIEKSSKEKDIQIYEGSLIQKIYYPSKKHSFIIQNPQKSFINQTNQSWSSLNKIVWILQKNSQKPQWTKICTERIRSFAQSSIFELRIINDDNIQHYLQEQILLKIQQTIKKTTLDIHYLKQYFYRLAILYEHGGVFISQSTIMLQNLDWLIDIGKYPSQYIFNRFDHLPKVILMFDPYTRSEQKWDIHSIGKDKSIKTQWHQQFHHDILIAEEGTQFIGEWLDTLFQLLNLKNYQIQQLFRKNKVGQHKASDWMNHNTFFNDVAKYLLGRKQAIIEKEQSSFINSAHYYKLWTINAYTTPFKLKSSINYQSVSEKVNPYLYQFPRSKVKQIIGEVRFFSSLTQKDQSLINNLLQYESNDNFLSKIDSRSFFKQIQTNIPGELNYYATVKGIND